MSIEAMNHAYTQVVGSPTRKAVLVTLANMADQDGRCWPSIQYIADRTELSYRAVTNALAGLAADRFLQKTQRIGKDGRRSNLYVIDLCNRQEMPTPPAPDAVPPAPDAYRTINNNHLTIKNIYTENFLRWWSCYPNKTGKKPAFTIWKKINPPVDTLIQHTTESALSDRRWLPDEKGKTYIPNPTTYLNQERWNDEIQRTAPTETGFERTARMAHEYLTDQGGNGNHDGQALDMDGRTLPPPMD